MSIRIDEDKDNVSKSKLLAAVITPVPESIVTNDKGFPTVPEFT